MDDVKRCDGELSRIDTLDLIANALDNVNICEDSSSDDDDADGSDDTLFNSIFGDLNDEGNGNIFTTKLM